MRPHISTLPPGVSAYTNDKCRCDGCREGMRQNQQQMRDWFRAHPEDARIPHGTFNGYTNYACRCDACRRAATEARRAWLARRKQVTR